MYFTITFIFCFLSGSSLLTFVQDGARVLSYHNNSMAKALIDLFPDIGMNRGTFIGSFVCCSNNVS